MRILVTGTNGFIGRYLIPRLTNHDVLATDRDSLDITDHDDIRSTIRSFEPDTFIHLAAATGRELATDPRWVIEHNVTATAVIARLCQEHGVRLVYFSSSEAYGEVGDVLVDEGSPLGPATNLYGLSKQMSEAAVKLYLDNALILRPVMPYGPGFKGTSMYPGFGKCALINFLWQALHDDEIIVHKGTSRSWIWIVDMIDSILLLLDSKMTGTFNLGVDDDRGMVEVAALACKLAGGGKIKTVDPPTNLTKRKFISCKKIHNIGWQEVVPLEEGMYLTLDWLRTEMEKAS